jgi:hypothetical protein
MVLAKFSENIFGIAISVETREHICLLPKNMAKVK